MNRGWLGALQLSCAAACALTLGGCDRSDVETVDASQLFRGEGVSSGPPPPPGSAFELELGRPYLQYGQALTIPFEVTNRSGAHAVMVEVRCTLRDASGTLVVAGTHFVDNVPAGGKKADSIIFVQRGDQISCTAERAL